MLKDLFDTDNTTQLTAHEVKQALEPDSLFERFAARKANQVGATKEFLEVKGQKFQLENLPAMGAAK